MNYRSSSEELKVAWFAYKATLPNSSLRLVDFVAGWNAAKQSVDVAPEPELPEFQRFYLNTNQQWGWVESFQELREKIKELENYCGVGDGYAYMAQCRRAKSHAREFGLYSEHTGSFLKDEPWWPQVKESSRGSFRP